MHDKHQNVFIVSAIAAVIGSAPACAQSVQPTSYEDTGTFQARRLDESSGVAVSRSQPGVLWTHNDSGDKARIYATNLRGEDLGSFDVRGAEAEDWEDIALGPCPAGLHGDACLYIADTGNNNGRRSRGTIYIVPEPELPAKSADSDWRTKRALRMRVRYPTGPEDVEALAVSPSGDVLLITKGNRGPVVLLKIPAERVGDRSVEIMSADTMPIVPRDAGSLVTAAAISPSGQTLAVRTYAQLYFFGLAADGRWQLRGRPCWIGLRQPQGEAVDFLDEATVVLTSESALGRKGGLALATCPFASRASDTP